MTTEAFVLKLCSLFGEDSDGVFMRARCSGWLETEDELFKDREITRKNAARIIHMYLKKACEIRDLPDITPAECLRDLYDCKVCANHVAQVYLRGIMDARDLRRKDGERFLWFDLDGVDDDHITEEYLSRAAAVRPVP